MNPTMIPTETTTAKLIARGRELRAIIDAAEIELDAIETTLRHRALAMPHEPLVDGYREGRRARLREDGEEVSVVFESDILVARFAATSALVPGLAAVIQTAADFDALFSTKTTHCRRVSDGHKFRLEAAKVLGEEKAARVIDLLKDRDKHGIVKSKSVVKWKP